VVAVVEERKYAVSQEKGAVGVCVEVLQGLQKTPEQLQLGKPVHFHRDW